MEAQAFQELDPADFFAADEHGLDSSPYNALASSSKHTTAIANSPTSRKRRHHQMESSSADEVEGDESTASMFYTSFGNTLYADLFAELTALPSPVTSTLKSTNYSLDYGLNYEPPFVSDDGPKKKKKKKRNRRKDKGQTSAPAPVPFSIPRDVIDQDQNDDELVDAGIGGMMDNDQLVEELQRLAHRTPSNGVRSISNRHGYDDEKDDEEMDVEAEVDGVNVDRNADQDEDAVQDMLVQPFRGNPAATANPQNLHLPLPSHILHDTVAPNSSSLPSASDFDYGPLLAGLSGEDIFKVLQSIEPQQSNQSHNTTDSATMALALDEFVSSSAGLDLQVLLQQHPNDFRVADHIDGGDVGNTTLAPEPPTSKRKKKKKNNSKTSTTVSDATASAVSSVPSAQSLLSVPPPPPTQMLALPKATNKSTNSLSVPSIEEQQVASSSLPVAKIVFPASSQPESKPVKSTFSDATDPLSVLHTKWLSAQQLDAFTKETGIAFKKGKFSKTEEDQIETAIGRYKTTHGLDGEALTSLIFHKGKKTKDDNQFWFDITATLLERPVSAVYHFVKRRYHPDRTRGNWTPEEDATLKSTVDKLGQSWTKVSEQVGRMATDCRDRYRNHIENSEQRSKGKWTKAESEKLVQIIQEARNSAQRKSSNEEGDVFWTVVSAKMGHNRSWQQCRNRWEETLQHSTSKTGIVGKKQKWSDNDALILVRKLQKLKVEDESVVEWRLLRDENWRLWSGHVLKKRWLRIKSNHDPNGTKSFADQLSAASTSLAKVVKRNPPHVDTSLKQFQTPSLPRRDLMADIIVDSEDEEDETEDGEDGESDGELGS